MLATRESLYLDNIFGSEERSYFFGEDDDIVSQEDGTEGPVGVARTLGGKTAVVAHDLNSVPGLCVSEGAARISAQHNFTTITRNSCTPAITNNNKLIIN